MKPKALNEAQKEHINSLRKDIGDEAADKIGTYEEDVGGGTPADPSQHGRGSMKKDFVVADNPDDPVAEKAKDEGKKVRYRQPRDEDGRFTYNSANAKKLYYGPSRGKTDLPFLLGSKFGKVFTANNKDVVIKDQTSYVFDTKTLTKNGIGESLNQYFGDDVGYKIDTTKTEKKLVVGYAKKKGKESKAEKEAKAQNIEGSIGTKGSGDKGYVYNNIDKNDIGYYFTDGTPKGMDLTKPNNPNIKPKTYNKSLSFFEKKKEVQNNNQPQQNSVTENKVNQNVNQQQQPSQNVNKQQPTSQGSSQLNVPPKSTQEEKDYGAFDKELASSNPQKFYSQNKEAIDSLAKYSEGKVGKGAIIKLIGDKGFNYKQIIKILDKNKNK